MSNWTQPVCDNCFKELFPKNDNPCRIKPEFRQLERCCFCGTMGVDNGLYVRVNPNFPPYPTLEKVE